MRKEKKAEWKGVLKTLSIVILVGIGIGLVSGYVSNPTISDTFGFQWGNITIGKDSIVSTNTSATIGDFTIESPTGRSATIVVAASDSSDLAKKQADYVCDGSNDNATFHQALDSITSGVIYFCAGNFSMNSTLDSKDNINIIGSGNGTVLDFSSLSGNNYAVRLGDYSTISNLRIVGSISPLHAMYGHCIAAGNHSAIENIVMDSVASGVHISGKTGVTILNCRFSNVKATNSWGAAIHISRSNNIFVSNFFISDCNRGIEIEDDSYNCYVDHGTIQETSDWAISSRAHNGTTVHNHRYRDIHISEGTIIELWAGSEGQISNIVFDGLDVYQTSITITKSDHIHWLNCNITQGGIYLSSSVSHFVFKNCFHGTVGTFNYITDNGENSMFISNFFLADGSNHAIQLLGKNSIVNSNFFFGNDYIYGAIYLNGANLSACNNYFGPDCLISIKVKAAVRDARIEENFFENKTKPFIVESGSVALIQNNYGYVTEKSGAASVANNSAIAHGCAKTPTNVILTPTNASNIAAATAVNSTHITVGLQDYAGNVVTVAETVYWYTEVR